MNYGYRAIICLFLCFFFGCAWFGKQGTIPSPSSPFIDSGRIVNAQKLSQGRKIAVIPFKAGIDVPATQELDKVALMIVKGISEAIIEEGQSLEIVTAEDATAADFILEGHITGFKQSSKLKTWMFMGQEKKLRVEGKMIDSKTREVICYFSDGNQSSEKDVNYYRLGLLLGQDIGKFILWGAKQ